MSLKDLVKAANDKERKRGILVPLINEYLNNRDTLQPIYPFWTMDLRLKDRHLDKRFHPSSISEGFCGREWVLEQYPEDFGMSEERQSHDVKSQRLFAIGNQYHSMVQGWFAQMGRLYGEWECLECGKKYWGVCVTKCKWCPNGDTPNMLYGEVPIDDAETGYLAHCDGEVLVGDEHEPIKLYAIEIKSCHSEVFKSVRYQPLQKHIFQAVQYMWVRSRKAGRQEGEPPRKHKLAGVIILYINKETGEIIEHLIEMTEEIMKNIMEPILAQMEEARKYKSRQLKTLPPRVCDNHEEAEFRNCPMADVCFSLPPKVKA